MKIKSAIFSVMLAVLLLQVLISCKKEIPKVVPTVTVLSVTNITEFSATSGGIITSDGGEAVTARGICWSTDHNPTTADNKTTDGSGSGSFTSSVTGLTSGAQYYIRAYAINLVGTAYSREITFSALALLPVLTTVTVTSITAKSAMCGGNITSDGGAEIVARGVCWSTTSPPTIYDSKTTDGIGTGSFTSNITNLEPLTTYYIVAYATNSAGTALGNQQTLTTPENLPTIPAYKTTNQYSSNGNRKEEVEYTWDIDKKEWVNYSKTAYTYDSQGHLTQNIYTTWDVPTQKWINYRKDTYSYYAFGKSWHGVNYQWDIAALDWLETYKNDYYNIDTRNSALYMTYYNWNSQSYRWEEYNRYRYEFTFNNEGWIRQQISTAYDEYQYGYYGNKSKGIFTYDPKGNVIDSKWSSWDRTWGWSDSGFLSFFKYDNNGNPTEKLISSWDSDLIKYVVVRKIVYTYDSNGNQVEYIEYTN